MSMQLGVALRPLGGRGGAEAPLIGPGDWCATKSKRSARILVHFEREQKSKKKNKKRRKSRHSKG